MPASTRRSHFVTRGLGLAVIIAIACATPASAGILRDVLSSVGLAKSPPKEDLNGNGGPAYPRLGFACCDLHVNKNWINDYNYGQFANVIPAGTQIEVVSYGHYRANIKVDGKPMQLGQEYGRDAETLDHYVKKYIVFDDPKPRIAAYPQAVQEAIRQGKVMIGMTREQVITAVGHPMPSENASLEGPTWTMYYSSSGQYRLYFSADGRLTSVQTDGDAQDHVIYNPGR